MQNLAPNGLSYDASGNVTSDVVNYYSYDGEGRICATETWPYSGGAVAYGYLYDAEGRRVAKGKVNPAPYGQAPSCDPSSNGFTLTESYVLGQGGERLTTSSWAGGTGTWENTNVYAEGKLIATYDSTPSSASGGQPTVALHFNLNDPLGTRRMQTNSAGQPELDCQSLPFGDQLYCFPDPGAPGDDPSEDATGSLTGIHFTGKERDAESGLDYFGARYYASSMGRFMSPDFNAADDDLDPVPYADLNNPQSLNLYSYVQNNPLSHKDADGHKCDGGSVGPDGTFTFHCTNDPPPNPNGTVYQLAGALGVGFAPETGGASLGIAAGFVGTMLAAEYLAAHPIHLSSSNEPDPATTPTAPVPSGLVGTQDGKSGQAGGRHNSGPLDPAHGGSGDAARDFNTLTGGKTGPAPAGSNYPPGTQVGDNGISLRPARGNSGPRIDIPANGGKPHETLHYPN